MKKTDINRLINPASIAVIGASETEGKPGTIIMRNLLRSKARLYPVNPAYETVMHIPSVSSVEQLPPNLDIAIITLKAELAVKAAAECALAGTAFIIIVAGGFGETGSSGRAQEDVLRKIVETSKSRILGPNSLGIFVPEANLDTIFVEHGDKALSAGGSIAFISQSGSVGVESLGLASNTGYGMRAFIGTGNKIDLSEMDFLDWFFNDKRTDCIALYLESIEGGRDFLELSGSGAEEKPVVVLKAGRTAAGAAAAGSHTGRLAGSDSVINGAFKQYGIQRAWDDEELCDATKVLSMLKPAVGNRVAVLTPAGGFGVMCTDYIDTTGTRADLQMAVLSPETVAIIKEKTFPFASCINPVDFTASGTDRMFIDTIQALLADQGVDIIICIALFAAPAITNDLIPALANTIKMADKPVLVFTEYGPFTEKYLLDFYNHGIAGFPSISRVVRAARFLVERGKLRKTMRCTDSSGAGRYCGESSKEIEVITECYKKWMAELKTPGKPDELEAKEFLAAAGLRIPEKQLILPEDGPEVLTGLHFPIVLKVCSPDILHKTDRGGVRLNIGPEEITNEITMMRQAFPGEPLIASPMVKINGPEMILGALHDPTFGASVMAGAGGILTELYRDTAFRLAPCSRENAESMLDELKIAPVLSGFRGSSLDKGKLAETISRFSLAASVVCANGGQIDINPIVWNGEDWIILDAKIILG
ncbi:MAG: acetate--CoA ligase family protein [Spirochaetales bacterium]|nr:acetate--CoA ligase family protein [Spirochaetales bacterium]